MRSIHVLKWVLIFLPIMVLNGGTTPALASTTVDFDQAVHFTTADGGDVVLGAGSYVVEPAEEWLRIIPSGGTPVDALLIDTQVGSHEESLETPLALSVAGEKADTHHVVLLLPDGKKFETVGTYRGVRSRGRTPYLTPARIAAIRALALAAASRRAQHTEFSSLLFGGSTGNRSYNLDCGSSAVMVGTTYRKGLWLNAIGIICQRVNPQTGALGIDFTRGPVGGGGGHAFHGRCRSGKVALGIWVFSGQFINGGELLCRDWLPQDKKPKPIERFSCGAKYENCENFGSRLHGLIIGGSENGPFFCPNGKVGKALRGRYGIYIDSLRFVCADWDK